MYLHFSLHDATELTLLHILACITDRLALATLEADLDNLVTLPGGSKHRLALADVIGQRLFRVDVKPPVQGGQERKGMPLRRGGNDHGLELLQGQQQVLCGEDADQALAALGMLGFEVGDPRLPLLPASQACREALRAEMAALGLLAT